MKILDKFGKILLEVDSKIGTDLGLQSLPQANFQGMNLEGWCFDQCLLDGANFERAQLYWSNFFEARARNCNFAFSDLRGASFDSADLTGSNFCGGRCGFSEVGAGADFGNANLAGCVFDRCDLEGAIYNSYTNFDPSFDPVRAGMIQE